MFYSIDYETRSACDIKRLGSWRYAEDPSTSLTLCAIAYDNGPVHIWDRFAEPEDNLDALTLIWQCSKSSEPVYAFNVGFEIPVSINHWEKTFHCPPPSLGRWRCSAVLARIAAIPASLEKAAEFLGLDAKKDTAGKSLIRLFCQPRVTKGSEGTWLEPDSPGKFTIGGERMTPSEAWKKFREYCAQDVEVERQIHHRLARLELKGALLEAFRSDLGMNSRGVPINLPGVHNAIEIVEDTTAKITRQFQDLTGLSPTQGVKVLAWLKERGYPGADMRAATVREVLALPPSDDEEDVFADPGEIKASGLHPDAVKALRLKALVSFAATKKLYVMRDAVCRDGCVHGAIHFYGARTGRSSGKLLQLQNFKRSILGVDPQGVPLTHEVANLITTGAIDGDCIEAVYGEPLSVIASSIRHFLDPGPGKQFLDIDLSNIEARVLAWVAGDEELLQNFRDGKDLYKSTAVGMFNTTYETVTKDQRQLAKIACLSLGYGGGKAAFTTMSANYGLNLEPKKIKEIVKLYREANPKVKALWNDLGRAAVECLNRPKEWIIVNPLIRVALTKALGYECMLIELPSGRRLHYPMPEVRTVYKRKYPEDDEEHEGWYTIPNYTAFNFDGTLREGIWATTQFSYYANTLGVNWGQIDSWGGSLTENVCQAIAADFLNHGIASLESGGYVPCFPVHDQVLVHYEPEKNQTIKQMVELFTKVPQWAGNFPLGAEADITPFYTKL